MTRCLRDVCLPVVAGLLAFLLAGVVVTNLGVSWWARTLAVICFASSFLGIDRILSGLADG